MIAAPELKSIFEKKYDRKSWYQVLKENFSVTDLKQKPLDITNRIKTNVYDAKAFELGSFITKDEGHLIGLYEVEVSDKVQIHRNRKGLRDLLSQISGHHQPSAGNSFPTIPERSVFLWAIEKKISSRMSINMIVTNRQFEGGSYSIVVKSARTKIYRCLVFRMTMRKSIWTLRNPKDRMRFMCMNFLPAKAHYCSRMTM